jgi:ketosteroid isomerase-like protein
VCASRSTYTRGARMPEDKVALLRDAMAAFNAHDVDAFLRFHDENVEFQSVFAGVGGIYHGHAGLREWFDDLLEVWGEGFHQEPEAFFDLGERALLYTSLHARGSQSGAEATLPIAAVFELRNGLIVSWKGFTHREDALRELGVSERELDPITP